MSQQFTSTDATSNYVQLVPTVNDTLKRDEWWTYVRKSHPAFKVRNSSVLVQEGDNEPVSKYVTRLVERSRVRHTTRRVCVPTSLAPALRNSVITRSLSKRVEALNASHTQMEDLPYHMSRAIDYFVFGRGKNRNVFEVLETYPDQWVLRRDTDDDSDKDENVYYLPRGDFLRHGKIHDGVYHFPQFVELFLV